MSRLGLLLAEVEGSSLATINPEAMTGITAQVCEISKRLHCIAHKPCYASIKYFVTMNMCGKILAFINL